MSLNELTRRRIAKPEKYWSDLPRTGTRQKFYLVLILLGGLLSLSMMWLGGGGRVTFFGLLSFELVLGFFLWSGYDATDRQNQHLKEMNLTGKVVGMEASEETTDDSTP